MISSLAIKNFILFDQLELDFSNGFNVFTGETGAGKSIIISAINVGFGGRASKEIIKTGKDKAFIEITLSLKKKFDMSLFESNGIDLQGDEIVISREISANSSRMRINGSIVSNEFMKTLRESVIDIHSQHQTYSYLQAPHHIKLLDSFGDASHTKLLEIYKDKYTKFKSTESELTKACNLNDTDSAKSDFLKYQINEIESAAINDDEEDSTLKNELNVLLNSEKLKELSTSAYSCLSTEDSGALNSVYIAQKQIKQAVELDPSLGDFESEIDGVVDSLKEISSAMRHYAENISQDRERLEFVESRLDLLDELKRKYGKNLIEVKKSQEKIKSELSSIELSQETIEKLKKEIDFYKKELSDSSIKITKSRQDIAKKLESLIDSELFNLDLPKAKFVVNISEVSIGALGCDKVEFLISTNVSEQPKSLSKIASGGELSRIMLALKMIFAKSDNIDTVIFDEIDSGISGKASQAVSKALSALSKSHQILSVTHQPIIAGKADKYFYISKEQTDTTKINATELKGDEKIKALALMASGSITEESVNFAKGLIK